MSAIPTIYPVVLCGGSGTRLWPHSRKSFPKQFSSLLGRESLFQTSVRRLAGAGFAPPLVVTGDDFRFIVSEQLASIETPANAILIEPEGRNTAPATLAAALLLKDRDPSGLMLISPSDHLISSRVAFQAAVAAAIPNALMGDIVTFGIVPNYPETGFGYLELAGGGQSDSSTPLPLNRFIEKPTRALAAEMLAAGNYLWNAGIFLVSINTILEAFGDHAPAILDAVQPAVLEAQLDPPYIRLGQAEWQAVENISVDYAVMEKASNLVVMPFSEGWSDLPH